MKNLADIRIVSHMALVTVATGLIVYIVFSNFSPFGVHYRYQSGNERGITPLGPESRVASFFVEGERLEEIRDDFVYFSTEMPIKFDRATVKVTFRSSSPNQELYAGFKDEEKWHFYTKTLHSPLLNDANWEGIGDDPVLYQREWHYNSTDEFLYDLPRDRVIGTYNYDKDIAAFPSLPDYMPSTKETMIDTPLRGRHILYVYVRNEPFKMKIEKQDLNWYEDPDVMVVKVYKDSDVVYTATVDDDGIQTASHRVAPSQELLIQNPGPGLPEPGIYKVVIDASPDVITKRITTNLHKIVFESPVFPVNNAEVYPKIIDRTSETKLVMKGITLSALTYHDESFQSISLGDKVLKLFQTQKEETTPTENIPIQIGLPKSNVVLKAKLGYFAFDQEQFFTPNFYQIVPITEASDLAFVDYILTDYHLSKKIGDWHSAEVTFDLGSAVVKDSKLSWAIRSPGIKASGGRIIIKNIEVNLYKDPLIGNL